MDNMDKMLSDKRKYTDLKEYLNNIVEYLNLSIENLELPVEKFNELFTIDTIVLPGKNLRIYRDDLKEIKKTILNEILPEIEKQLSEIKENIESAG